MPSTAAPPVEGKSNKSARDTFFYYTGAKPPAVRYKNWKFYYTMVLTGNPADALLGAVTYHWSLVGNIKRDPFEMATGQTQGTMFGIGGALAGPVTAYVYDWNMLPVGQQAVVQGTRNVHPVPAAAESRVLQPDSGPGAGQTSSAYWCRERLAINPNDGKNTEWGVAGDTLPSPLNGPPPRLSVFI